MQRPLKPVLAVIKSGKGCEWVKDVQDAYGSVCEGRAESPEMKNQPHQGLAVASPVRSLARV